MKIKTIKHALSQKFKGFLGSITDEEVKKLVKDNTIITGGSIASMLLREEVNDYDLYFRNKETVLAVANYYVKEFGDQNITVRDEDPESKTSGRVKIWIQSNGVTETEETEEPVDDEAGEVSPFDAPEEREEAQKKAKPQGKYKAKFFSSNAITLGDKIQIVIRFYGEPAEIHDNYDFVHCMNYWSSWSHQLVLNTDALASLLTRELQYCGSKYPLCSIIRSRKFIKRAWTINAGQYLKMAMQLNDLDLRDIKVLEDQLVGVDAAYFQMLIAACQKKMDETGLDRVDSLYIAEIIDRIF